MGKINFHDIVNINVLNNVEGDQYNNLDRPDAKKVALDIIIELKRLKSELTPDTSDSIDIIYEKVEKNPDSKESIDMLDKVGAGVLNILEVTKDKLIPIANFAFKHKEELSQVVNSATKMLN